MEKSTVSLLRQFAAAAKALSEAWNEDINEGYPFDDDFAEIVQQIADWKEIVEHGWPIQATTVFYDTGEPKLHSAVLVVEKSSRVIKGVYATFGPREENHLVFHSRFTMEYLYAPSELTLLDYRRVKESSLIDRIIVDANLIRR